MLMQMLAAGGLAPFADGHRAPDASNPRGYAEHDRVRAAARDASQGKCQRMGATQMSADGGHLSYLVHL